MLPTVGNGTTTVERSSGGRSHGPCDKLPVRHLHAIDQKREHVLLLQSSSVQDQWSWTTHAGILFQSDGPAVASMEAITGRLGTKLRSLCFWGPLIARHGLSPPPPSLLRSPLATSVDNVCAMQRPLFPHDSSVFLFYLWVFAMLDYNYPWIFATLIHPIRRGRKGVVGSGLKSRVSRC